MNRVVRNTGRRALLGALIGATIIICATLNIGQCHSASVERQVGFGRPLTEMTPHQDRSYTTTSGARTTELVSYPSAEVEFICGPQLKSGSSLNPAPWFDRNASARGIVHGEAFPASPPLPPADTSQYHNQNYYDQGLVQYINYYRTGDPRFLTYARKISDSWWRSEWILNGTRPVAESFAPRSASLGGLMLRALDGRPEMWPWITEYVRAQFHVWVGMRVEYPSLYYGIRDGGYMLLYAAYLAKVHPNEAVRKEFMGKALRGAENYYARLQRVNGAWVWRGDHGGYWNQPFQQGILLEGLIGVHRLTGSESVKQSILKGVSYLFNGAYRYRAPITDAPGKYFRSLLYNSVNEVTAGPLPLDTPEPEKGNGSQGYPIVEERRQLNATTIHAFGYAYKISGNVKYREWGDEIFDANYSGADGYRGLAWASEKEYNQSYRAGGRYLVWRLGGASSPGLVPTRSPAATPNPTSDAARMIADVLAEASSAGASSGLSEAQVKTLVQRIDAARKAFAAERARFIAPDAVLNELDAAYAHTQNALAAVKAGGGSDDAARVRVNWAEVRLKRAGDRVKKK